MQRPGGGQGRVHALTADIPKAATSGGEEVTRGGKVSRGQAEKGFDD